MDQFKFRKIQAAKLLFLVLSLTLIPFVSASLRPSYLYFLLNILIVVLGYESGILHVLVVVEPVAAAGEKTKKSVTAATASAPLAYNCGAGDNGAVKLQARHEGRTPPAVVMAEGKPAAAPKPLAAAVKAHQKIHGGSRNPSVPSIFFIGSAGGDGEAGDDWAEEDEEDVFQAATGEISSQELFARAESFIGDFYRQLKLQREESWKKIHGFYHKNL